MSAHPVLTLADLEGWSHAAPCLAVLGQPIRHSVSPPMHQAALADLARTDKRFADWRYFRFEVSPQDLPRALDLLHAKRFRGLNLTVPHKVIAFDRVAAVDEAARPAGAVNTLLWTPEGWKGFNTDGYGLRLAVRETLGLDLAGTPIVLLGAGGAARGAAVECLTQGCSALWIANRTRERLDGLRELLRPLAERAALWTGTGEELMSPEGRRSPPEGGYLLINATSSGLRATDAPPIDLSRLPRAAGVFDMIYNPPRTPLLRQAESLGLPTANGLAMLAQQGAKALEVWTGIPAERTASVMLNAARTALG